MPIRNDMHNMHLQYLPVSNGLTNQIKTLHIKQIYMTRDGTAVPKKRF